MQEKTIKITLYFQNHSRPLLAGETDGETQ